MMYFYMYLQPTVPESCLSGTVGKYMICLFYLSDCFQTKACCIPFRINFSDSSSRTSPPIVFSFTKIQYGRKYIEPWCFTFTQKNPRQYYYQGCTAGDLLILSTYFFLTITLSRCQISSTYSWMVLSEVNLPLHAVLRRAFFAQPFSSLYASSTRF